MCIRDRAYTAGVLASFATLGGLILALRSGGIEDWVSWGFQLQFPRMVSLLGLLMFMLGLSLSGMWYANIRIGGRTNALAQGNGVRADFFTGVLAVVLSTPCTAPFMGAALAYAFVAPTLAAMLVFLMLGLGLALPFLLIAFVPALARQLPKPGAWMDTLKQLLAFPMYATAAWLVWVLAQQRGADAVGLWMGAAILLALAAWAWTHAQRSNRRWPLALAVLAPVSYTHLDVYKRQSLCCRLAATLRAACRCNFLSRWLTMQVLCTGSTNGSRHGSRASGVCTPTRASHC